MRLVDGSLELVFPQHPNVHVVVSFDRLLTGERGKGGLQTLSPSWDKKPGRAGRGRRQLWLRGQLCLFTWG